MPEDKIKFLALSIVDFIEYYDIRHLDPNALYFDQSKIKVIVGDLRIFGDHNTEKKDNEYTREQLRFMTPEKRTESQILWDLGVILYELCTGNIRPFEHSNQQVNLKLI